MTDIALQLLVQVVLILLNAFFAATEIAVISLNEKKVKAKAEDGDKKAKKMLKMIEEPTAFLSTIQVGITLAGFLGSAFAADNFADRLSSFAMEAFSLPPAAAGMIDTVAVILITLILSFFTLVFGELVPKRVAMQNKEALAEAVCGVISGLAILLRPVIKLLSLSTNGVLRLMGIDPNAKEEPVSEEDIVLMLDAGADEGALNEDDVEYIKNVLKLDRLTAQDVMTPRKAVVFLAVDADEDEIQDKVSREGHPRIPVYEEDDDHVIGILHAREYLLKKNAPDFDFRSVLHPPVFVPETVRLDVLFKDMQTEHTHMVIVVNEYGETAGVVTIEDILEEILGEIWVEEDQGTPDDFVQLSEYVWQVKADVTVADFADFFKMDPPETEATTLNGWLCDISASIPEVGFVMTHEDLTLTVTAGDEIMAHELRVEQIPKKAPENEEKTSKKDLKNEEKSLKKDLKQADKGEK